MTSSSDDLDKALRPRWSKGRFWARVVCLYAVGLLVVFIKIKIAHQPLPAHIGQWLAVIRLPVIWALLPLLVIALGLAINKFSLVATRNWLIIAPVPGDHSQHAELTKAGLACSS
jgi:hypothetical protein